MKRTLIGAVIALGLFGAGAAAQDRIFAFRGAFQDIQLGEHPCGANGLKGSASITVYDRNATILYTCNDDRVIVRRYFNPNDNAITPVPVFTVPMPGAGAPRPLADCSAYPGFVLTKDGTGCVPPDHPSALR